MGIQKCVDMQLNVSYFCSVGTKLCGRYLGFKLSLGLQTLVAKDDISDVIPVGIVKALKLVLVYEELTNSNS